MSQDEPHPDRPLTVAVVDDDPLVRTGLRLILGGAPGLTVAGEAEDGADAAALVREKAPDVVLMDIRMPRVDGLEATRQVLALPQPPAVIVLTTFDTDDLVLEALRIGAVGFLLKSTAPEKLVAAIRSAADGEHTLSPSVTSRLISAVATPTVDADADRRARTERELTALTEREHEVAVAIGRGWSNAEIAARLYMGVPTVKAHVSRVLTKLALENRTQVALLVHDAGLTREQE